MSADPGATTPMRGYWLGAPPKVGGQGSMVGPDGTVTTRGNGWTPTVTNLAVLIALEIVAYCALRYAFRSAHGG